MKNTFKIFGIIALAAVIGLSMVSCKEDEGTKLPDELVAKWYYDEDCMFLEFEIFSDGTVALSDLYSSTGVKNVSISVSGNVIYMTYTYGGYTLTDVGNWKVAGKVLTLDGDDLSFEGVYYKK